MKPKEKAEELVCKYLSIKDTQSQMFGNLMFNSEAKECALIAVNEIIKSLDYLFGTIKEVSYYREVKQEIEKL